MRCADPESDDRVLAKLGTYLDGKKGKNRPVGQKHVCYAASTTYNCCTYFVFDPKKGVMKNSFVPLVAD
jgi:hypothetical protein